MYQTVAANSVVVYSTEIARVAMYGAPAATESFLFDEASPNTTDADICKVEVNGFKIEFYSADYSSLLWSVRDSLETESGHIKSFISSILLPKKDAQALIEVLESRKDIAAAERAFHEKNAATTSKYFKDSFGPLNKKIAYNGVPLPGLPPELKQDPIEVV